MQNFNEDLVKFNFRQVSPGGYIHLGLKKGLVSVFQKIQQPNIAALLRH